MANRQYPVPFESSPGSAGGGGSVTSVGLTVNGTSPSGIFTVTGSPVTVAGTLNVNLAGTSGGVPYFSSSTVMSSSGLLPTGDFVLGGGAGSAPTATFSVVPVANGGTATGSTLTGIVRGGNPFTASEISGDATTSGSNVLTLATVNANVGSFTGATVTVNAKGLVTAASSGSASPVFVDSETPSGTINGSNVTFTLANTPTAGSLHLYLNGARLSAGGVDYTLATATITFVVAPKTGNIMLADYRH